MLTYTESNHAVWADNVFLVANHATEAQLMLDEITQALNNANLHWKAKEAAIMTVGALSETDVILTAWLEQKYMQIKQKRELTILGSLIDNTASTTSSMMYR